MRKEYIACDHHSLANSTRGKDNATIHRSHLHGNPVSYIGGYPHGFSPAQRSCDMKLYSILLGWIGILTKSCVSPQVFYGSRRLTGCPGMLRGRCQRSEAFRTMQ
jgi:hypothetical protein